jgi:hypothetical protein
MYRSRHHHRQPGVEMTFELKAARAITWRRID